MENPQAETVTAEITVTGLQTSDAGTETAPAETQPEIVVIENNTTVEQTPESNTRWQEEIAQQLRDQLAAQQNQTAQVIQTIQEFRETLTKILDCQLRMETALAKLIPSTSTQSQTTTQEQPQQETPAPVPVQEITAVPAAAEVPTEQPANDKTRKRRKRI